MYTLHPTVKLNPVVGHWVKLLKQGMAFVRCNTNTHDCRCKSTIIMRKNKLFAKEMKKYIIIAVVILIICVVIGLLCRRNHSDKIEIEGHADTVYIYDTIRYSRLELESKTYTLDVPKTKRAMVLMPIEKTDTVLLEKKVYVTMEREWRYTETDDVQIWHSGIDSTIDSLNVIRRTEYITETVQEPMKRNYLSFGLEAGYSAIPHVPIYLQYERMLHKNVGFYVKAFYDLPRLSYGVSVGAKVQVGW